MQVPISAETLINLFETDLKTLRYWSSHKGMPKTIKGKYDFIECVKWRLNYLKREAEENKILTRKTLAHLLGYKNEKYINELERDFGLPKKEWNKYDIFEVIPWFINYKEAIHKKEIEKLKQEKPQDELARKQSRLKELEIAEREGRLIDLSAVKIAWLEEYKLLDELLDSIAPKLCHKLVKKDSITDIRIIIENEIKTIKEKIAKNIVGTDQTYTLNE